MPLLVIPSCTPSSVYPVLLQLYLFGKKSYMVMSQCIFQKDRDSEDHRAVTIPEVTLLLKQHKLAQHLYESKKLSWA